MACRFYLPLLVSFTLIATASPLSGARGIKIDHAASTLENGVYLTDAHIVYHFSDETRKALEHGVSLQIDIELRVKKHRPLLWDKTIATTQLNYMLEHHPLSGYYLVTNMANGRRRQFQDLAGALDYLGTVREHPLVMRELLDSDGRYSAQIRASLNIQALPAPLRPLAYVSTRWQLASPWHGWVIQQ